MATTFLTVEGYDFSINDTTEDICVSVHKDKEVVELFRLKEGHLALTMNWSDEKIAKYLIDRIKERTNPC
jgi:hypothetical protein